jgi:hypothetical protein
MSYSSSSIHAVKIRDSWSVCAEWTTSKYHKLRLSWISSAPPGNTGTGYNRFISHNYHLQAWLIRRQWISNWDKTRRRYCLGGIQARHIYRTRFTAFAIPTIIRVSTHEWLRCAADCTGTQRPVYETPIITAPCPAALEPNRGSSRMLLQAGRPHS